MSGVYTIGAPELVSGIENEDLRAALLEDTYVFAAGHTSIAASIAPHRSAGTTDVQLQNVTLVAGVLDADDIPEGAGFAVGGTTDEGSQILIYRFVTGDDDSVPLFVIDAAGTPSSALWDVRANWHPSGLISGIV